MNLLVTAGNTQSPIDDVRCITNIFSGRTGGRIAVEAYRRGHTVTIATSHPHILAEVAAGNAFEPSRWQVCPYKTYDDLHHILLALVPGNRFDAIVQSAAISDYTVAGRFVPDANGGVMHSKLSLRPGVRLIGGATHRVMPLNAVSAGPFTL